MKNKSAAVLLITIGVMVLIGALIGGIGMMSYVSAYNYGNTMDKQLVAIKDNNKNIYANGTQKILEMVQVPTMYKDDLKEVITADIQGRYGKNGSQASMQWLKEHEVKLDPTLYIKIQQTVEGFRNEFQNNQTRMIDVKRSYSTAQGYLWQGFWLRLAGYPKVNMNDYNAITTDATESVFKTGKEVAPLKLR